MAQVGDSLSGNWWISYADSEGLKALCWALKLVSDLEGNAERSDYYSAAAERLGMDDLARRVGEVLTFRHIRFFAGDLYQNKRLVYFWRDNGAYDCPPVDRTTPVCGNIDLSRSGGLHSIFAQWFEHWVNGSVGALPDGAGRAVAQADDFQVFCYFTHDLCHPRPKKTPGKPAQPFPMDGTHSLALEAVSLMEDNTLLSRQSAVQRAFAAFRLVQVLPVDRRARMRCIVGNSRDSAERRLVRYIISEFEKSDWPYSEIPRSRWPELDRAE